MTQVKFSFIPAKYSHMIDEVVHEGRNGGYWIYLKRGFFCSQMGCQTIHETNQKSVLKMLKECRAITVQDALNANYIQHERHFESYINGQLSEQLEKEKQEQEQKEFENTINEEVNDFIGHMNSFEWYTKNSALTDRVKLAETLKTYLHRNNDKGLIFSVITFDLNVHFAFGYYNEFDDSTKYCVLSAYFNGENDRTTYSGLHNGKYDIQTLEQAQEIARQRN